MISQKAISVKLDADVAYMLDQETATGPLRRNRLINEAIKTYIKILDARRKRDARISTNAEFLDYLLEVAAIAGHRTI